MNDNDNSVSIEIEECNCSKEQFDKNAEEYGLYKIKISNADKEDKTFTIKAQTVKIDGLKFKRRKIIITDNKNTSMTYFIDGVKKHIKGTNDTSNDLQKINNKDVINEIIDVLKHNKNIELNNKSINLCFKNEDGNTYKCNGYEKYKPYDYEFVNETELKSSTKRLSENAQLYVASGIMGLAVDRFKNMANSYNRVAGGCLDTFKEIKKLFTNK